MRRIVVLMLAVLAIGVPVALAAPMKGTEPEVEAEDFAFQPAKLFVRPGAAIKLENRDRAPHNVRALRLVRGKPAFQSSTIRFRGETIFRAPSAKGTYQFICSIHPRMKGTLTVR